MDIEQRQAELIDSFVKQASTHNGSALATVIVEATSHPSLFAFSEILAVPNVVEVCIVFFFFFVPLDSDLKLIRVCPMRTSLGKLGKVCRVFSAVRRGFNHSLNHKMRLSKGKDIRDISFVFLYSSGRQTDIY